ncbi:hypothetical protein ACFL9U_12800, partial [Thermodesulfobacteriota bacterium]
YNGRMVSLLTSYEDVPEGYNGNNGWAFEHTEPDGNRDAADAQAIYRILEEDIIPRYYKVTEEGVPEDWVTVMKESIKSNAPRFSARRMVKDYIDKFYVPCLSESER